MQDTWSLVLVSVFYLDACSRNQSGRVRGAYFILQLHDELIYEVSQSDFTEVAGIIKENMENAMKLSVKLPVKLKAGPSWGSMQDINLWN